MAKQVDRSSVDTFAKLEKNYALFVQRMKNFDQQVEAGSFPKKTMNVYIKELKKYIGIVTDELETLSKKTDKLKNQMSEKGTTRADAQTQQQIGQLKLTQKKMLIIQSQLQNTYNKRSHVDSGEKKQSTRSAESLGVIDSLSKKFLVLYKQYQKLNGTTVSVQLDDEVEQEIEKSEGFLWIEVDYLTNITNMLVKIDDFHKQKKNLCRGDLRQLKDTWRDLRNQKDFIISTDVASSDFAHEYSAWLARSNKRMSAARDVQETFHLLHQLKDYKDASKKSRELLQEAQQLLNLYDINIIRSKLKDIITIQELKQALGYVQKKAKLLEPFMYGASFARDEIELIIRDYQIQVESSQDATLTRMEKERERIQARLAQIEDSLQRIKKYKYTPFESLEGAQAKTVKLRVMTGERGVITAALHKKIEKTYTKQYEYLMSQVGNITSGGRRNHSGGSDILGDLLSGLGNSRGSFGGGGGRSLGGGSSFGGSGWSGSGGTSW